MRKALKQSLAVLCIAMLLTGTVLAGTYQFSVCSWNVRNFGLASFHGKNGRNKEKMKSEEEITSMIAILKKLNPDILGLNEIIQDPQDKYIQMLRARLKQAGLDYPYFSTTRGEDTRIQNVLLSRYPIKEDSPLNQDTYTVTHRGKNGGEPYTSPRRLERGIINCLLEINPACKVRVMVVHLKSPLPFYGLVGDKPCEHGDDIIRRNEAVILKNAINRYLQADPNQRVLVMGDFNDNLRSKSLRTILSGTEANMRISSLNLADYLGDYWTHFYAPDREYHAIDHMLASPALYANFSKDNSFIYRSKPNDPTELNPMTASDHRPLFAVFSFYE